MGKAQLRYVSPPNWGASLAYYRSLEWGQTPFPFDEPDYVEEIELTEQSRFSRRWGGGFNWAWDLDNDKFARQECHITYIFDSFQVSLGWDFYRNGVRVGLELPGYLY